MAVPCAERFNAAARKKTAEHRRERIFRCTRIQCRFRSHISNQKRWEIPPRPRSRPRIAPKNPRTRTRTTMRTRGQAGFSVRPSTRPPNDYDQEKNQAADSSLDSERAGKVRPASVKYECAKPLRALFVCRGARYKLVSGRTQAECRRF